ncbi:hypothetical protein GCM10010393_04910 [Streptomyces gobitricini]|uniref:Uncharacterized protein n=1 Tax=Streptomyces gobitricini TaxID=68211 RepID=A0ABN3L4Q3_9ACTN
MTAVTANRGHLTAEQLVSTDRTFHVPPRINRGGTGDFVSESMPPTVNGPEIDQEIPDNVTPVAAVGGPRPKTTVGDRPG